MEGKEATPLFLRGLGEGKGRASGGQGERGEGRARGGQVEGKEATTFLILLYMCPHKTVSVSSYSYICVRILLYVVQLRRGETAGAAR